MAEFDFTHRHQPGDEPLVRALLRRAQRIARNLSLDFRYSWRHPHWSIVVNGPLPMMQTLIAALSRDWRPFAEGFPRPPVLRRRQRAAQKLLDDYCEGAARMREMIEWTATRIAAGTHYSFFFDVGAATHLAAHARDLSSSLILFHDGQISASQIGEMVHTFVEAVAKTSLRPSGNHNGSFSSLVQNVALRARLDPDEVDALLQLKDLRRDAKHRGQRISADTLASALPRIVGAVQKLTRSVRQQYAARNANRRAAIANSMTL